MAKIVEHRLAELFCGPGGIGLGALMAGLEIGDEVHKIKPVWANDIDEDTCKTYFYNIHRDHPENVVCAPIEQVNLLSIPAFEGLTFGFPCNDFSIVGEQKGIHGKFGKLYSYGADTIDMHKPKWFIAENVGGLKSANGGQTFKNILADLESCGDGYNVTVNLYKFNEYGVPQQRERIIFVGIRKDLGVKFKVPAPTTKDAPVSAREAIENPPILEFALNNEITKQSKTVVERLRFTPAGKNVWFIDEMINMEDDELTKIINNDLPCLSEEEKLKYSNVSLLKKHLKTLTLNVKGARLSQIYKRLSANLPSYTMTGSGGGGTHGYHWKEPRALTNRERARIQTFTDNYAFAGSKESVRKQIGMAVPPKGIKIIFEALLKTLAHVKYNSVKAKV